MPSEIILEPFTATSLFEKIVLLMPEWFQQGGVVMWLLLLTSFISTVVTLERLFVWFKYYVNKEANLVDECFALLEKKETSKALLFCKKNEGTTLNMLAEGIRALPFDPSNKIQIFAEKQLSYMSKGQTLLDTVITMAPMLGILGTVFGIIDSFNILSLEGVDDPTAVIGGIAKALISTAAGLIVALLALLPYNLFRSFIRKFILNLESVGTQFTHICHSKDLLNNKELDAANETINEAK